MGRDKAFVEYDGVPMVQLVATALRAAGCAEVVAIGGDAPALAALGLQCVPDEHPGEGPLGGVITALHHYAGRPCVMVVACDLPRLTRATVVSVMAALAAADGTIGVAMAVTDRPEPACAAWRPAAVEALLAALHEGERRVQVVAGEVGVVSVPVPATDLANVNTPADLPQ